MYFHLCLNAVAKTREELARVLESVAAELLSNPQDDNALSGSVDNGGVVDWCIAPTDVDSPYDAHREYIAEIVSGALLNPLGFHEVTE